MLHKNDSLKFMYNHVTGDQFFICSFWFQVLDTHAFSAYLALHMKITFHVSSWVISYLFMKPHLLYVCATELFCMV